MEVKTNVDVADTDGKTVLLETATAGHLDVVCTLVEAKVDIDAADTDGATGLIVAASQGHLDVVRTLVEVKVNTDAQSSCGTTLDAAELLNQQDIVLFLSTRS